MTATLLIGDVFDRMAVLETGSFDLIITSPPFLALRSYLPSGHPDKAKEIGSETTPAAFLDTLLALTAEWGRLLAPHGSIAVELGDTYSGSGGGGGDYYDEGLRAGQGKFAGSATQGRRSRAQDEALGILTPRTRPGPGQRDDMAAWPMAKSLAMIPELYAASLAYGRNLLTNEPSPAGRWRVRNFKPWIRSNPPVGALGDKERPATSYVTVATRAVDRYFDLDAVRTTALHTDGGPHARSASIGHTDGARRVNRAPNAAGAPPLDWWHHVDAVIDAELDRRVTDDAGGAVKARGVHIRRALERAGILTTLDALDVSPKGYAGAHYAVWPPELVQRLIAEMCPRRVCTTCGQPSRSDCGHGTWRLGHVLDPFAGSGTTLAVAAGMGHTAVGIDIDWRSADLAAERVGFWLEVIWPAPDYSLAALPRGGGDYRAWITDQEAARTRSPLAGRPGPRANGHRTELDGQLDLDLGVDEAASSSVSTMEEP